MTGPLTVDAFGDQSRDRRSALDHEAEQLTAAFSATSADGLLVVAVRPGQPSRRVVASAGNSAIRAAVSVAVAAGNTRAWAAAKPDAIVEIDIATLPEIVRAAVAPAGVTTVRVACVECDADAGVAGADCLLMWLSVGPDDSAADAQRAAELERMTTAAKIDREQAALAASRSAPAMTDHRPDPAARLLDRDGFDAALSQVASEETGVVVLAIDDQRQLGEQHGAAGIEAIESELARRLARRSRATDLVARLGAGSFALVLVDLDRRSAFELAKRIRTVIDEPVELPTGSVVVDVSLGLAHEVGLIDPVELFESAMAALEEAVEGGGARTVIAS